MPTKTFYSLGQNDLHPERHFSLKEALHVVKIRSKLEELFPKKHLEEGDLKHKSSKNLSFSTVRHVASYWQKIIRQSDDTPQNISKSRQTNITHTKDETTESVDPISIIPKPSSGTTIPQPVDMLQSQFIQSMVLDTASRIEHKYRRLVLGLLTLFVLLIIINLYTVFYLNFSSKTTPVVTAQTQTLAPNLQQIKNPETGLKIVREFAGNSALADIGFQLSINKTEIKTKGSPNCKTPIIPPMENGCHFLLIPTTLGIPNRGVLYRSIGVDTSLGEGDKIYVEIKNYEKDKTQTVATIDSTNLTQDFSLPENIPSNSGILFRLWAKNKDITIRQINLRYFAVDDLKQVAGTLAGDLAKIEEMPKIYYDTNQNSKFDKDTDKEWVCRPNFPGAKLSLDSDGKFVIDTDDVCFVDVKPDCWYKTKVNKCALPIGKWLLVYETKPIVIPFEITDNIDSLNLKAR